MKFGERLKQTRQQEQLTQATVADTLHVSRQTISSWETGHSCPDIDSLIALSDLYQLSLDTLLKEDHGMADTLRKPEVFEAIRQPLRNLTIVNVISMTALLFADQLASTNFLFFIVAMFNLFALRQLREFSDTLNQENDNSRRLRRRPWIIVFAIVGTIGAIWAWSTNNSNLTTDFIAFAVTCWFALFFTVLDHQQASESAQLH